MHEPQVYFTTLLRELFYSRPTSHINKPHHCRWSDVILYDPSCPLLHPANKSTQTPPLSHSPTADTQLQIKQDRLIPALIKLPLQTTMTPQRSRTWRQQINIIYKKGLQRLINANYWRQSAVCDSTELTVSQFAISQPTGWTKIRWFGAVKDYRV